MPFSFTMVRNIGLSVMVVIILVMGLFFLTITGRISRSLSLVMERERPKLEMAEHVRKQFVDAKDIFIAFTREEQTDITPAVIMMNEVIKQSVSLQELVTEEEKKVVAKFITAAKRYKVASVTYGKEFETDPTGADAHDMEKVAVTTVKQTDEALAKMIGDIRARIKAADQSVLSMSVRSQRLTWVGMVMGVVSGLLVAFFMGRGLSTPLRKLTSATDKASIEGDLTQRVEVKGKDDIARLGRTFNKFMKTLHGMITEREVVAEIGRIVSSTLEIDKVYEQFAKGVKKVIPFDRIVITLIDYEKGAFMNAYVLGQDVPGFSCTDITPLAGSFTEEVMRKRTSQLIQVKNSNEVEDRFPTLLTHFQAGLRSFMGVPLISKDRVIGVLILCSGKAGAYTEVNVKLVESIGSQIAGAIANAQLYAEHKRAEEALQRLAEEREVVAEIGRIISSTLEIEKVYEFFVEEVRKLILSDRIAITIIDRERRTFWNAYILGNNVPDRSPNDVVPLSGSFTEEVMRMRVGQLIQTESRDEVAGRFPGLLSCFQSGFRSFMAVPLISKDQVIGVLHTYSAKPEAYTEADVSLAESIGAQIAGAIANAQLYAEQKRAEEELKQTMEELARSNTELEQFAYVASHDLREPLRKVGSYTEMLARRYKGQLDEKADKFIGYIMDGTGRMQGLINDLLKYSRVGRNGDSLEPTNFADVMDRVISDLEAAIQENGAVVTHDPLPTVIGNTSQMAQLFQNLIGNAIKFRGEQSPRVHVSAEQKNGEWLFSVRDNGIGIDQQYAERIFVIFQRLHTRAEYSGTGIGLAICKKIVESHGGRIWVESQPGEGTTFSFTIPACDS